MKIIPTLLRKRVELGIGLTAISTLILAGCGGGGSGSAAAPAGPVASTLSFPLLSGYQTLTANGSSKTFTISGTCSGTLNLTWSPATVATTFEAQSALSATETGTMSLSNCAPANSTNTSTLYYNSSNYLPLGLNSVGVNYGVYLTPATIPTNVTVGGSGVIGTETLYTDSSKTVPNGRSDDSYLIEADTSTTAILNSTSKIYNSSSILTSTEQDRYRMTSTGALTPISLDIQYANGSTTHLIGN